MQYIPVRYVDQAELAAAVDRAIAKMGDDVVRVRYAVGEDTGGDPALYFRIVLSDEAGQRSRLAEAARQVRTILREEIRPYEMGLIPYFSFRSRAEQAALSEPEWS
jgi:hypothetical protein